MIKYLLVFLTVFLYSCGGVVPDNGTVIPAIRAGVPTVEIHACGEINKGLAICSVTPNQDLSTVQVSVQGYYKGRVSYVTSGCPADLDESVVYDGHRLVNIPLSGVLERDCLITVTLSPRYRGFEDNGVIVWPIEGHIYLRRTSRSVIKQTDVTSRNVNFSFPSQSPKRVVWQSTVCDINYDNVINPTGGTIDTALSDLTLLDDKRLCIINGANVDDQVLLLWLAAITDSGYNPLPLPGISQSKRQIKITTVSDVTAIIFNDKYKYGNEAKFRFDPKERNILRLVTAKGRSVLGVWEPSTGAWSWK